MQNYKDKIDELRTSERAESNEFLYQICLVGTCIALAWFTLGHQFLVYWFVLVYGLTSIERYLHNRNPQPYCRHTYILYISIGTGIAFGASLLPIYLWTFDDRLYHYAAMIYMVGTVLNTFIVRSTAWPALLCFAIPNALGIFAVAVMFALDDGWTIKTLIAFVLAIVISTYLVIMVRETVRKVKRSRDITKALLLAQKSETLANFSGGVAHDFNNLLSIILASLEQANEEKDEATRRYLVGQAIAAVERGSGLTQQLLTVGRRTEYEYQVINIEHFTDELQQFLTRILPSSVHLRVTRDPNLMSIVSEPTLLQSMLLNLAMNAREAMADRGTLSIYIEKLETDKDQMFTSGLLKPGQYAAFRIEDNGPGISEDVFGKVLEPFFTTRPVGEGTGLGLAMVAGFSEQVGGALDVSTQEGVGTVVRFFLPLTELPAEPEPTRPNPVEAKMPSLAPKLNPDQKVLLVEDEANLNAMLTRYLTLKGLNVLSCETGDAAVRSIDGGYKPDVVITDLVMPGDRQGTDLVKHIRGIFPDVTAIMISGYSFNQQAAADTLSDNNQTFILQKPFKLSDLDELLTATAPPN